MGWPAPSSALGKDSTKASGVIADWGLHSVLTLSPGFTSQHLSLSPLCAHTHTDTHVRVGTHTLLSAFLP